MRLPLATLATLATLAFVGPALAASADEIIDKEKCHKCHTEKDTKKAPAWASIAAKYKGNADAPNKIFMELKKGGKVGDEDDHKKVEGTDAEIKSVVQVVLSSK
jgi:cytochrome c